MLLRIESLVFGFQALEKRRDWTGVRDIISAENVEQIESHRNPKILGTVFCHQHKRTTVPAFFHSHRAFFVSFRRLSRRQEGHEKERLHIMSIILQSPYLKKTLRSAFFLEKKVAKKTLAVKKMPKPSFAGQRRKTILKLNDASDQNVYESRFSHYLILRTRVSSAFFSRPRVQIPGNSQRTFLYFGFQALEKRREWTVVHDIISAENVEQTVILRQLLNVRNCFLPLTLANYGSGVFP